MIIPTKIMPLYKSLIYKGMILIKREDISYDVNNDIFSDITEYLNVVTIMYALGYLNENGDISYDLSTKN